MVSNQMVVIWRQGHSKWHSNPPTVANSSRRGHTLTWHNPTGPNPPNQRLATTNHEVQVNSSLSGPEETVRPEK